MLKICRRFECSRLFKCPNFYCIPWEYVCDGKWDCPRGLDESGSCFNRKCTHMYKCNGQNNICLHLTQLCDGIQSCPEGDDELFCDLQSKVCPHNCQCILYGLLCYSSNLHLEESLKQYKFISLVNVMTKSHLDMNDALYYSLVALGMNSSLTCGMLQEKNIKMVDIRGNSIHKNK